MATNELQRLRTMRGASAAIPRARQRKKSPSLEQYEKVQPGSLGERLLQAGIFLPLPAFFSVAALVGAAAAYLGSFLGSILAIFSFAAAQYYLFTSYLDIRAVKRRNLIIPHLPGFIDGLSSALSTGFNLEGAVVQATQGVPLGLLRGELDRVVNALGAGLSIEEAFVGIKRRVAGREIISLAVAIVLFHDMGGRILEPFQRLSEKIRDQQVVVAKAQRDLVQIKQAFNIILFLSVVAPGALLAIQPDYLDLALKDWIGRVIVQFAIIMQIIALLFFKKMTNFRL